MIVLVYVNQYFNILNMYFFHEINPDFLSRTHVIYGDGKTFEIGYMYLITVRVLIWFETWNSWRDL